MLRFMQLLEFKLISKFPVKKWMITGYEIKENHEQNSASMCFFLRNIKLTVGMQQLVNMCKWNIRILDIKERVLVNA